jgi:hypothetical protein
MMEIRVTSETSIFSDYNVKRLIAWEGSDLSENELKGNNTDIPQFLWLQKTKIIFTLTYFYLLFIIFYNILKDCRKKWNITVQNLKLPQVLDM